MPKVDHVHQDLHVALRLHVASHHAETKPRLAVFGDHRGNDGVKGSFVRFQSIQMFVVKREQRPAVLQHEANIARRDFEPKP